MLHLYDTATREVRELALREPGTVSVYLCGPTVYGPTSATAAPRSCTTCCAATSNGAV